MFQEKGILAVLVYILAILVDTVTLPLRLVLAIFE